MTSFYMVTGMVLVTFSIRYGLLAFSSRIKMSAPIQRALRYVPPVVLTAIIVPAVLYPDGPTLRFSFSNSHLVGAAATAIIGKLSNNLLITIVGGMACFALCRWLLRAL